MVIKLHPNETYQTSIGPISTQPNSSYQDPATIHIYEEMPYSDVIELKAPPNGKAIATKQETEVDNEGYTLMDKTKQDVDNDVSTDQKHDRKEYIPPAQNESENLKFEQGVSDTEDNEGYVIADDSITSKGQKSTGQDDDEKCILLIQNKNDTKDVL